MAVVKWDQPVKKDRCVLPSSEDANKSNIRESTYFSFLNSSSQFYCKREVIVQNSKGDKAAVARIEKAVFACNPQMASGKQYKYLNEQSAKQFDSVEKRNLSRRKQYDSSKIKSDHKGSRIYDKSHHRHRGTSKNLPKKTIVAVSVACSILLWWLSAWCFCQVTPINFIHLETSLKQEAIGQQEALNLLLLSFYKTSNLDTQPPVFLLTGSTGVGKSFFVDLVLKHFPGLGHKELLFYPTQAPESVAKNLKNCEHNLLVIDSLYFKDSQEVSFWVQRLQKEAVTQRIRVWILLAFTTEHWTSDTTVTPREEFLQEIAKISTKIEGVFQEHGIATQLITFQPMEVHHVKECARKEVENLKLWADETQLDRIVHKLTSTPSLRLKGCKHVNNFFLHSDNFSELIKAVE